MTKVGHLNDFFVATVQRFNPQLSEFSHCFELTFKTPKLFFFSGIN